MSKISMKIKKLRERKGLTQVSLAKNAGLALATIEKIEGKTRVPTLETRKKLAKALGVPITELLD